MTNNGDLFGGRCAQAASGAPHYRDCLEGRGIGLAPGAKPWNAWRIRLYCGIDRSSRRTGARSGVAQACT